MKTWIEVENDKCRVELQFDISGFFPNFLRGNLYQKPIGNEQPLLIQNLNELIDHGFSRPETMAEIFEKIEEKKHENENEPG